MVMMGPGRCHESWGSWWVLWVLVDTVGHGGHGGHGGSRWTSDPGHPRTAGQAWWVPEKPRLTRPGQTQLAGAGRTEPGQQCVVVRSASIQQNA